jgi:translation initiation factor IF-3
MFRPPALLDARRARQGVIKLESLLLLRRREGVDVRGRFRTFSFLPYHHWCGTSEPRKEGFRLSEVGTQPGALCLSPSARSFATRGARDSRWSGGGGERDGDEGLLTNERLVAALCINRSTPDAVKVRVIAKVGSEMTSQVTSLSDAIQLSLQHSKDLIGVALDHDVPVVKVDSIRRLASEAKKSQSKSKLGSLTEKEVRFQTGIAENDFQRKADTVARYLDKGHTCMLSVMAKSRNAPGEARDMATKIIERVSNGELMNQLQAMGDQRTVQFRLRPTGARRSKEET